MTTRNIPLVYRLWFLWLEPAMALNGARLLWFQPETYHDYMPIKTSWHPGSQVVCDQLAATYMLFAFNQAVTLRTVHDVSVWKVMILGMALSDVGYIYSIWETREMLSPGGWSLNDWVTWVTTVGPFFLRLAFLLGVGLDRKTGKRN